MQSRGLTANKREKKLRRKEVLEKKKAVDDAIRAASAVEDHLASYPPFIRYDRNGLSVYLESGYGGKLSSPMKSYIKDLLKSNMAGPFGIEWPTEEKIKNREMVAPEARYVFVRESSEFILSEGVQRTEAESSGIKWMGDGDNVVGFVHYRFTIEEGVPVVYVYELQLQSSVQHKGLGKFLMQLIELIARKNHMGAVMLTVQKSNVLAMNFYTNKLGYVISSTSPSRVDPLIGAEKSYEILCKAFSQEAKDKLQD